MAQIYSLKQSVVDYANSADSTTGTVTNAGELLRLKDPCRSWFTLSAQITTGTGSATAGNYLTVPYYLVVPPNTNLILETVRSKMSDAFVEPYRSYLNVALRYGDTLQNTALYPLTGESKPRLMIANTTTVEKAVKFELGFKFLTSYSGAPGGCNDRLLMEFRMEAQ